ncbi:class I poly(R)-hydroxyalkanoic acid synthase [Parvularcula oceani]|uniref:class I poly(R)-hydroxyalkanoic acid synthase n=1 Tax=Parvularcula oceani TaxID=1247963 RepID=UPI0009DEC5DA|nr:class I poly(R)-hydroxyalkanoic acid synthase [Parvularcula oceani]
MSDAPKKPDETAPRRKAPARKTAARKSAGTKAAAPKSTAKKTARKSADKAEAPAKKAAAPSPKTAAKPEAARADASEAGTAASAPKAEAGAQERFLQGDMARFAEYMTEVNLKAQDLMKDMASRSAQRSVRPSEPTPDPFNVSEAARDVATALASDPARMMKLQMNLWSDYTRLFTGMAEKMSGGRSEPVAAPAPTDKRFSHAAWEENPTLDFVKQSYLLMARWVNAAIDEAPHVDEATRKRAHFHADQFLAALSPTNVPALNPEVYEETIETQGANWLAGMKNFVEDLERGHGELAIRQADLDYFRVGENVATTPGKVVYQNDLMQLIQYSPTTEEVAERPLVIFPPWINKFYILDLQPENSFIKWAVDQGRTVFVVSWVNPGPALRDKSFPDYMREGVFEALEAAERATGVRSFDTIGYCIGGTLLAVTLAYMAKHGDERINTATFFTAQTDFSEAGDLRVFIDDRQLAALEKQIDASGGVLEGSAMARTFNMLRPNDLIWQAFVDNYYKGKEAKKFDLLYWNSDATRMTKACHLYYLRNFYRDNALSRGDLNVEGTPIALQNVKIPVFMQAGEKDHIAPPRSIYKSARLFGGEARFMLAGSGHIAGVVNPPARKKYHYRTNDELPETMEAWCEGSDLHEHSWWPYWDRWLRERSPGTVPARQPGDGDLPVLEEAPGSYVKVRSD